MNKRGHYRGQSLIDLTCSPDELPAEPAHVIREPRRPPHEAGCFCVECHNAGVRYADYLAQKSMNDWWEGS
jgi:hypothetical protein